MFGYMGEILHVDLTRAKLDVVPLDEAIAMKFIGGKGLGAKLLFDGLHPDTEPLSPGNLLIFATGPLTATLAPSSARFCVVTKSPLTDVFLDSQVGGSLGVKLKRSGFDAIMVRGRASSPVYLKVDNGNCELLDADALWGQGCIETDRALSAEMKNSAVGCIGPGGEHLVRFACISINRFRQAGRGGAGAVMGSKNLKALVVSGDKRPKYADESQFKLAAKNAFKKINEHGFTPLRGRYGTPIWVHPVNQGGLLPTRNFQTGVFEAAERISGETMREQLVVKDDACPNCSVHCWKWTEVGGNKLVGPEYETIALLGSNCGIGTLGTIASANLLCDDLSLDTISTGNVIGFAMECSEAGIIDEDIRFGDDKKLLELIEKIAARDGIGELLAEGVHRASTKLDAEALAVHVKGMEVPGYDPRGAFGMALAYATSDRGACHQRAWTVRAELDGRLKPEDIPKFVKEAQDERALCFSLVLCDFMPLDVDALRKLLSLATGYTLTEEEYLKAGERIWNLTRLFNVREGITREDDNIPHRFMEPMPEGSAKGKRITPEFFNRMLDEYYELRGWDENGVPTDERLEALGLE